MSAAGEAEEKFRVTKETLAVCHTRSCRFLMHVDDSQKEFEDDAAMRKQFGHKWNRRPSEQVRFS